MLKKIISVREQAIYINGVNTDDSRYDVLIRYNIQYQAQNNTYSVITRDNFICCIFFILGFSVLGYAAFAFFSNKLY